MESPAGGLCVNDDNDKWRGDACDGGGRGMRGGGCMVVKIIMIYCLFPNLAFNWGCLWLGCQSAGPAQKFKLSPPKMAAQLKLGFWQHYLCPAVLGNHVGKSLEVFKTHAEIALSDRNVTKAVSLFLLHSSGKRLIDIY